MRRPRVGTRFIGLDAFGALCLFGLRLGAACLGGFALAFGLLLTGLILSFVLLWTFLLIASILFLVTCLLCYVINYYHFFITFLFIALNYTQLYFIIIIIFIFIFVYRYYNID